MTRLPIIFLAPRLPWPLDTGGKIRTFHLLRALARRHRVTLLSFQGPEADDGGLARMQELDVRCELLPRPGLLGRAARLARGLAGPVPAPVLKYQSPALLARLRRLLRDEPQNMLHCDHLHMAPYGPATAMPFCVDEHNVETLIWRRFAADQAEPRHRRLLFAQQAFWLARLERRLTRAADLVLLCSDEDRRALQALGGGGGPGQSLVVPNGVDVDHFAAGGPALHVGHVFFTGSMDWAPNENAVLAFLEEMLPVMRRQLPGLEFLVVGRNPGRALTRRNGSDGVTVTGTVPDVRPYMRGALALVVPMRVGGGTRLKILEAFAAGVPVISTALGIEGIDAEPGTHYLQAETAGEFAAQALRLRREPALGQALARAASVLVRGRYSWDAIGASLAEEYARRFDWTREKTPALYR